MLESISLRFTESDNPLVLPAQGITVFVGPNNSGKSFVLKEFQTLFGHGNPLDGLKIVQDFEIVWPNETEVERDFDKFVQRQPQTSDISIVEAGYFNPGGSYQSRRLPRKDILDHIKAKAQKHWISAIYLSNFLVRLDGRTRFDLTNDR